MKKITLPMDENTAKNITAGELFLLSGTIITARDAAHKRIFEMLRKGETLPFTLNGNTVYYVGPCPKKHDEVIGSCGPTTSGRVDSFTPLLLDNGLKGMIGKGERSAAVISSMIKNGAVYFAAIGGAGALYSRCVKKSRVLCFPELLSEAVYELEIEDFPVVAAIDCRGNSIYKK